MNLIFSLLLAVFARAESLDQVELDCWGKGADQGAFLCQYVLVMGKAGGQFRVASLAAPDEGGPKTWEQAQRGCQALGFRALQGFELARPAKEEAQAALAPSSGFAELSRSAAPRIEHLLCRD